MRLKTIWTIPSMSLLERLRRSNDWGAMTIAAHLPKRIRYWTTILEVAKATKSSPHIPAEPLENILKNLDAPKGLR